jgi:hypothetical protein
MEGGYFISSIHDRPNCLISSSPRVERIRRGYGIVLGEVCHSNKDLTLPYQDNVLQGGPSNYLTDLQENYRSEVPQKYT